MSPRSKSSTRKPSKARRKGRRSRSRRLTEWKKLLIAAGLLVFLVLAVGFVYYYVHFSRMIDARLSGQVFNHASLVYAAPTPVRIGEPGTPKEFAAMLEKAGYTAGRTDSHMGSFEVSGNRLIVRPGPDSFFHGSVIKEGPARLTFSRGHLTSIVGLRRGTAFENYWLEPEVITTLFGRNRAKRRIVKYQQLPKVLIDAVVSAEDHTFFTNPGINVFRILAAAFADLRAGRPVEGASTLTMQLARNFFLTPRRTIRRKLEEVFITFMLERRLSKQRIFDLYANEIYLGQSGSFSIYGFGEAANAYFNKNVSALTLPQAALLAGIIRGPNFYSPYRHAARATQRRNHVLKEMAELGYITSEQAREASEAPLQLAPENVSGDQAPYFVDMIQDQLLAHFSEQQLLSQSYRIYTTLDLRLQRAASQAVKVGMEDVDKRIARMPHHPKQSATGPKEPQVALVVLDPHTGEIRALVGGRNYVRSQLNHALALRQPGSSFKPFVYAAALNSAIDGSKPLITPATTVMDEPTVFKFGDQTYAPKNYEGEYMGLVTVRQALAHSLNVATVKIAQMTGYERIRNLAIEAGINKNIKATPAIALGAYVATPLEIAGSYTVFDNAGRYEKPRSILAVNDSSGKTIYQVKPRSRQVLDPRISFLVVSLMQSVISEGTGQGVRKRGFMLPAAAKTGTSHDGWFAGFTTNLVAVAWVGYDNDRELNLPGAKSALPVWTAFMKRASELPGYQNVQPFPEPPGIVTAPINAEGQLVAQNSPAMVRDEYFIQGTQPESENPIRRVGGILGRIFHAGRESDAHAATNVVPSKSSPTPIPEGQKQQAAQAKGPVKVHPATRKKGGLLRRFLSIFKGGGAGHKSQQPSPGANPP